MRGLNCAWDELPSILERLCFYGWIPRLYHKGYEGTVLFNRHFLPNSLACCHLNKSDQQAIVLGANTKYGWCLWTPKTGGHLSDRAHRHMKAKVARVLSLAGVPEAAHVSPDHCGCGVTRPDCCHLFPWGWPCAPHTFVLWATRNVLGDLSIWQPSLCEWPCLLLFPVFLGESQGLERKNRSNSSHRSYSIWLFFPWVTGNPLQPPRLFRVIKAKELRRTQRGRRNELRGLLGRKTPWPSPWHSGMVRKDREGLPDGPGAKTAVPM